MIVFSRLSLLALSLALILLPHFSWGTLVNITVDDWYRDPLTNDTWVIYEPFDAWRLSEPLSPCSDCLAHPDPLTPYFQTWHESVYTRSTVVSQPNLTATFDFEGVAVYVFCILTPLLGLDMMFYIDGEHVLSLSKGPGFTSTYKYNEPVYANKSLSPGPHTIKIYNGGTRISLTNQSLVLLDYIVYTRDTSIEPIPSTFLPSPTHNAVGTAGSSPGFNPPIATLTLVIIAIVGSIVVLVLVALAIKYWRRFWRTREPPSAQFRRSVGLPPRGGEEAGWVDGAAVSVVPNDAREVPSTTQLSPVAGPSRLPNIPEQEAPHGIEEVHRAACATGHLYH